MRGYVRGRYRDRDLVAASGLYIAFDEAFWGRIAQIDIQACSQSGKYVRRGSGDGTRP